MALEEVQLPFLPQEGKYHPVHDGSEDGDDALTMNHRQLPSRHKRQKWMFIAACVAQSLFMFILGFIVARWNQQEDLPPALGTYETLFTTEKVVLPKSLVKIEQRKFTGGVDFTEDGELFLLDAPAERTYVGEPNGDIDEAWHNLLDGRYFSLSEQEAKTLWGEGYEIYRDQAVGGFTGGFDMFHSLHCLNQLRMALHRDYYPENPHHNMTHQWHCIDHLRQVIQCQGAATIIPTKWRPGIKDQYVDTAQTQTCRNFDLIHEYMLRRHHGDLHVPRPKGEGQPYQA